MWPFILLATIGADPEILPTVNDAVVLALEDATKIPEHERPFQRFVWIPEGEKNTAAAVSFAINTAWSKASIVIRPNVVAGGKLVRVDLLRLLPKDADLSNGIKLWDEQASRDPYLYQSVEVLETVPAYRHTDGKTYTKVRKRVATFSAAADLKSGVLLAGLLKTGVPIQRADRFIVNSLTTLDGGLYYKLAGIKKSDKAGVTDFEKWLDDHGVSKAKAIELRADRRAAVFRSGVTAKPRAIEEINGLLGVVTWSEDIADGNVDPKAHPVLTLLDPKFDAVEAIALRSNGLCDFALFDAKGALQDVVPDTIARDHTIPSPFTSRLQPAISCIRCHAQNKGFNTTRNDVATLLRNKPEGGYRFDILGDEKVNQRDVLDRLAGLYRGNLERLNRARDDYSDAVFLATGGLSVAECSGAVASIQDGYQFSDVSPQRACEELGVRVGAEEAVSVLRRLLPPESAPNGIEDARIGFLKAGVTITRADFEQVYIDAAIRSRPFYETLAKEIAAKPQKPVKKAKVKP